MNTPTKTEEIKTSVIQLQDCNGTIYPTTEKPLWWQKRGLMYTATGYGKKIPTSFMALDNGRLKRVYCYIFSNSGTLYFIRNNEKIIVS